MKDQDKPANWRYSVGHARPMTTMERQKKKKKKTSKEMNNLEEMNEFYDR